MNKVHQVHAPAAVDAAAAAVPQLEADTAMEHEADRMAAHVGAAPSPRGTAAAGQTTDGALAPALQREMQGHFGHDFSQVRVHADAGAAQQAAGLQAAAFTVGRDLFFNRGRFAPHTRQGRALLAHELTHVVQQSKGAAPVVQRQVLGGAGAADDEQATMTWESYRQSITLEGFDSDRAELKAEHLAQLDAYKLRLRTLLARYPDSFFSVIGHTDATDSEAHNKPLGQRRADAVKAHLSSGDNPVPATLISAGSLGESALAVPSKGREARNRRVEIIPTLRRTSLKFPPPEPTTVLPGTGAGGGRFGDKPGGGSWIDPDPLGLSRPKLPDLVLPRHNWLEDALARDPLIRSLPRWMGDKLKDALKDGDEMLAEKVIDALPLDDKTKAAVQAVVKGVLQLAKGKTFTPPVAPPQGPDFGPQRELPKAPGEVIIPGPKFEF